MAAAKKRGGAMRTKPALTSADVQQMASACRTEAQKNKWSVSFAVVDDAGYALYLERMDGAGPLTAEVATAKARTAAVTRRPTKFWEDLVKERPVMMKFPDNLPIQGGLPIMHQGECVGAIGVSGVQSHQDEQIAAAGVAALG
jgi:glc operon protein GlcG